MKSRLAASLVLVCAGAAVAGSVAPAPRVMANLHRTAPPGGPLRVDVTANCTASLPAHPEAAFRVSGVGGDVAGTWVEVPRRSEPGFQQRRLEFRPAAPLAPGKYSVRGLQLTEGFDDLQSTEVPRTAGEPPFYGGPDGLQCSIDDNPRYCQRGVSIYFRVQEEDRRANPGWLLRVRARGAPYADADAWEGTSLPLELLAGRKLTGALIATLDQRDESGREGHYLCEVPFNWPDPICAQFPAPPSATGAVASKLLPAQCPNWQADGTLVSAIDGQVLFQAPALRERLRAHEKAMRPRKAGQR